MSPRQFGKVDVSASWARCPRCPAGHPSHSPCPPTDTWLVLTLCKDCNPKTGLYCRRHRSGPPLHVVETIPAPPGDDAEYARRIGEEGAA